MQSRPVWQDYPAKKIRIRWPDGEWSHVYKAFADNFVRMDCSKPAPGYWLPPPVALSSTTLSTPAR